MCTYVCLPHKNSTLPKGYTSRECPENALGIKSVDVQKYIKL